MGNCNMPMKSALKCSHYQNIHIFIYNRGKIYKISLDNILRRYKGDISMKRKTLGLLIGMLLVVTAVLPAMGTINVTDCKIHSITIDRGIEPLNDVGTTILGGNIKVSTDEDDDVQPTITSDPVGRKVVAFATEHGIFEKDITLSYSEDGSVWVPASTFSSESGVLQYPSIVGIPEAGDVGFSYIDPLSEYPFTMWRIGDVTDSETYNGVSYSWGETEDYQEVTVTYVHELLVPMFTMHNFYISEIPGCPFICYVLPDLEFPTEIGGNYFDGQSVLQTAPASNIDMATGQDYFYLLFERYNETSGHSEIAFKKSVTDLELLYTPGGGPGGMDKYADIEAMPWQFYLVKGDFDAKDPSVAASGSNVVVAYMTSDNIFGDWDIRCAYSNDNGETFETSVVAEGHPTNEAYPAIHISGNNVFCSYIQEGNLYLVKSEDGGATWGEPEQVNEVDGTVVEEPRSTEMSDAGIVWTDNRDGNKDIYYMSLPIAIINIESISGGFGVSAVLTNVGTADAIDVQWSIKLDGLVFLGSSKEGPIDILVGEKVTVKTGLVFGLGAVTITVTCGGATKTADGTILGPLIIGL